MVDDTDQNAEPEWLRNLPLRSEELGFAREELTACANCGRANAPNRTSCLYCGFEREDIAEARIEISDAEDWENGYNVVLVDTGAAIPEKVAGEFAAVVKGEEEFLRAAFETGKRIPIMRTGSEEQARAVRERLGELGITATIVDDESLKVSTPPVRLRSIEFGSDSLNLKLFNIDEVYPIEAEQLALIVVGVIFEDRNESVERRKRKGSKKLDESAMSSDEPVIDIYSKNDPLGWRIPARGFDFSSLGSEKSLVVAENMKTLITKLAQFAPGAKLVDDYASLRALVEVTWPSDMKKDTRVVRMGRKDFATVLTTSNSIQFTKYSRLQWRLLYEEKV